MAATTVTEMKIYNDLAQTSYLERIQDRIQVFNQNSQNALRLVNTIIPGDFQKKAFYQIGGSIATRDVTSTSTVTPSAIGADEMISVKVPWKYGPYATTEEAFKRRARNPEEFSMLVGQDMADAVLAGQLAHIIAALTGAISANTTMIVDDKTLSSDGKKVLSAGLRTMGDKFGRIAIWVMDSGTYFDIVDQAITDKIYEEAGLVIYGGQPGTMGKPVLVSDACTADYIFGLQPGAAICTESQVPGMISYPITNQENMSLGFRGEGAFNVEVMGYSWDTSTGGSNPESSDLSTAANWDKYATDDKNTAGFLIDLTSESGS